MKITDLQQKIKAQLKADMPKEIIDLLTNTCNDLTELDSDVKKLEKENTEVKQLYIDTVRKFPASDKADNKSGGVEKTPEQLLAEVEKEYANKK